MREHFSRQMFLKKCQEKCDSSQVKTRCRHFSKWGGFHKHTDFFKTTQNLLVVVLALALLAEVRPAQNLGVREVQLLELVQIVARGRGLELDRRVVSEVGEPVVVGGPDRVGRDRGAERGGRRPALAAGRGAGLLLLRGGGRWRVDTTVVDGHRGAVPLGGGRSVGGRGADQVGGGGRGRRGGIRIPRTVQGSALLAGAAAARR